MTTTLGEVATAAKSMQFPALAVVGDTVALRDTLSWFETKPLFGWNVLVPAHQGPVRPDDPPPRALRRPGHDVVPTISVEPPRTPQQMERAVKGLVTGRYEWVGFTSVNAVKAIREKFEEFGLDARSFAGLKVAAVGGVTADALREWGIDPDLVPAGRAVRQGPARRVAALRRGARPDQPGLPAARRHRHRHPRRRAAGDGLGGGRRHGIPHRPRRSAGRADPRGDQERQFDAVVFTSTSTVRNLVGIAGKPHPSTVIACIGPATAKTAEEHGLRVDVLAPEASADSLVDALADYGRSLALRRRGGRRAPRCARARSGPPPVVARSDRRGCR